MADRLATCFGVGLARPPGFTVMLVVFAHTM